MDSGLFILRVITWMILGPVWALGLLLVNISFQEVVFAQPHGLSPNAPAEWYSTPWIPFFPPKIVDALAFLYNGLWPFQLSNALDSIWASPPMYGSRKTAFSKTSQVIIGLTCFSLFLGISSELPVVQGQTHTFIQFSSCYWKLILDPVTSSWVKVGVKMGL